MRRAARFLFLLISITDLLTYTYNHVLILTGKRLRGLSPNRRTTGRGPKILYVQQSYANARET